MLRTILLSAFVMAASPVFAQNPQPAAPADPNVHVAPPSVGTTPPEKIAPPVKLAPSTSTMSDRLAQQKGTVTPPNVDPGMTISPPANTAATTPVIPPPGSPGGNRSVVPK